ncbi:MAG: phosphoenolpyruvate--protein phosphotransferase [Gemmatimonadales bacterium]|nr:phosphoenolpyruvate--protein phosphotransferase [Gemmatimonadales bacterium]
MSIRRRGVGVSPGVAFAPVVVVRMEFPEVPDRAIGPDEVADEVHRLHAAAGAVAAELDALRERVLQRAGPEESRIFDAQMMMVQDAEFLDGVEHLIRQNLLAAETAYEFKALELRAAWSGSASAHLRDRLADLHAIQLRMLGRLMGEGGVALGALPAGEPVIVVARELSPGLTVQLDRDQVAGLLSEEGTRTSHAAILAHSLGIPAVMGARDILEVVQPGTVVLLDGATGDIVVDPTREELEEAMVRRTRRAKLELVLEEANRRPAETPGGRRMRLYANVDLPDEIEVASRHDAAGVGLLRTEFLVTGRATLPSEDEQARYFARVATAFAGKPVVVRSYDLGGDKFPAAFRAPAEANPMLGWRSIRVCLDEPDLFRAQLRALLRAAHGRDLRLMLPLVIGVDEVLASRALLAEEAAGLAARGIKAAAGLPVGVMIETPAAVVLADRLAEQCDFFSVGTNDLTQYTLAVDRGNARLADRFSAHHPAVLRQLRDILRAARAASIPAAVCGEMASEPIGAVLLAGLGYEAVSVAPPAIPLVKWVLGAVPDAVTEAAAEAALRAGSSREVVALVREHLGRYLDLALLDALGTLPGGGSRG